MRPASALSVRIATYNIHHGAPPGRCVDHRSLIAAVGGLDAEVIGLQEVDRHVIRTRFADQTALVARSLGMHGAFGASRWLLGGHAGNALITDRPPRDVEIIELPRSPGGDGRSAVVAVVDTAVGELSVAVTHLQNARTSAEVQLEVLLGALDQRLAGNPSPAVLMGDLNLPPEAALPRLREHGWTPVEVPPTFPSHGPDQRLDWVVLRGLECIAVEVPDVRSSDHRPVVAEARMAGPPA